MTDEKGYELTERIAGDIRNRENIFILTGAEVISTKGSIGNFEIRIRKSLRKRAIRQR